VGGLRRFESGYTVGGDVNGVAFLTQTCRHEFRNALIVFYDQEPHRAIVLCQ
jgi:hypothetical protein